MTFLIGSLLIGSWSVLSATAISFDQGYDILPYKCSPGSKVCSADCREAYTNICNGGFADRSYSNATIGNCVASWYNPAPAINRTSIPSFQRPTFDKSACLQVFEEVLTHSGGGPECSTTRMVGGTALIYTDSKTKTPESSYIARLEPSNSQPCCYIQKNCDPNKVFGKPLICKNNAAVLKRADSVAYAPAQSISTIERRLSACPIIGITLSSVSAACVVSYMMSFIIGIATEGALLPELWQLTSFFCLAPVVGLSLAVIIQCVKEHLPSHGGNKARRAVRSIDGPTPAARAKNICNSVTDPSSPDPPSCLQMAINQGCAANSGTINVNKVLGSSS